METERKFLMDSFPGGEFIRERFAEQYYISVKPYVRLKRTLRRDGGCSCRITFKSEGDLSRLETEIDITEKQFKELRLLCGNAKPLKKRTRVYSLGNGLELEVSSVNEGEKSAFMYAEVEFPDEAAAAAFVPLPCMGKEVTYDASYKMNNVYAAYNRLCI